MHLLPLIFLLPGLCAWEALYRVLVTQLATGHGDKRTSIISEICPWRPKPKGHNDPELARHWKVRLSGSVYGLCPGLHCSVCVKLNFKAACLTSGCWVVLVWIKPWFEPVGSRKESPLKLWAAAPIREDLVNEQIWILKGNDTRWRKYSTLYIKICFEAFRGGAEALFLYEKLLERQLAEYSKYRSYF